MLLALLFDAEDRLVAAALAVDQQPLGNRYWREVYPQSLDVNSLWQTAYVQIDDEPLVSKLMSLAVADTWLAECRVAIEAIVGRAQPVGARPTGRSSPKAA